MNRSVSTGLLFLILTVGCGPSGADGEGARSDFEEMESRLLAADEVSFSYEVLSEGVLESQMNGRAVVTRSGDLAMDATGRFIGETIEMTIATDADSMRMETTIMQDVVARPPATFEAVIVGMTRMGIMHNLAQLTTVSPPERSEGGVSEWVSLDTFAPFDLDGRSGVSFDILVEGQKSSDATLIIEDGLPVERRQVVMFGVDSLIVTERYRDFVIQ